MVHSILTISFSSYKLVFLTRSYESLKYLQGSPVVHSDSLVPASQTAPASGSEKNKNIIYFLKYQQLLPHLEIFSKSFPPYSVERFNSTYPELSRYFQFFSLTESDSEGGGGGGGQAAAAFT